MAEGWLKVKGAAEYSGVSIRTLRTWVKEGLVHSRLPTGTILISVEEIDRFLKGFEVSEDRGEQIRGIVEQSIRAVT